MPSNELAFNAFMTNKNNEKIFRVRMMPLNDEYKIMPAPMSGFCAGKRNLSSNLIEFSFCSLLLSVRGVCIFMLVACIELYRFVCAISSLCCELSGGHAYIDVNENFAEVTHRHISTCYDKLLC